MLSFTVLKFSYFIISLFFTKLTSRIFVVLLSLMRANTILFNDFLAGTKCIKNHVNRHPSQLTYDTNLFGNFKLFNLFLTNFKSSVKFAICLGIPSSEGSYHMAPSPPICNINLWTGSFLVGDFSVGYSQTDYNFNFNINVNVTVNSYMNSSFISVFNTH